MALKWLRDNLRHLKFILWGVVAVFVLLVFVDWGAGGSGPGAVTDTAVKVGDTSVTRQEFLGQMRRFEDQYAQQFGDRWNEIKAQVNLYDETVAYFTNRILLLEEAERAGIHVADAELRDDLLKTPLFQDETGAFVGPDVYQRIIRTYFQMTPQEFEELRSEEIAITKLTSMMQRGVYVAEADVEKTIKRERELADFDAVMLPYERYLGDVSISEEEARGHYQETADDFLRDEQRVIRYLVVETSRLRRQLPVDDAELQAYYDEHRDEFLEGEQAQAAHILIRLAPDADVEAQADAELRANGVAQIAQAGGDFTTLAAKHSEDPGTMDRGGDLGWFGRGGIDPEFEKAVFAAKPGDIVGPVRSQYGFHIIRVDGFRPESQRPFEDVVEQIRFRVLEGRASVEAEKRARELARRLESEPPADDAGWQLVADEDEAVVLNESPPVAGGDAIPGTGEGPEFTTEIFAADVGSFGGPRAIPRGWMVWQLKEIRPEGIAPCEDVRLEQDLRHQRALDIAAEKGAELAQLWREGGEAEALAEQYDGTVSEARDHRWGTPVGTIGATTGLDDVVFGGSEGAVVGPIRVGERGVAVARIETLRLIGPEEMQRERDAVRARLLAERAQQLLVAMLNERRRDTVVTADDEFRAAFSRQG